MGADLQGLATALSVVFRDLPDSIRLLDRESQVVYGNEASLLIGHEQLTREADPAIKGQTPDEMLTEVIQKGVFKRQHLIHRSAVSKDLPDYYEVTIAPLRDESGAVIGALEILRDESMNFGLQHYLIGRSEKQEKETARLQERETTLASRLGNLEDRETDYLYRDRVSSLGQLTGGLAHEIRTPLGAILSSVDLLGRTLGRLAPGEAVTDKRHKLMGDSVELIREGSQRIHGVLNALQNFSRLDEAPLKEIDLADALESTLRLLQYRLGDRISVRTKFSPMRPVRCRPDAISQVFMNLMVNAMQAIPERGEIRLSVAERDGMATATVADDGIGIADDQKHRLFELGYTTRAGAGGSGLGLALCRRIVEQHGGLIEIDTGEGRGTRAIVHLPFAPEDS